MFKIESFDIHKNVDMLVSGSKNQLKEFKSLIDEKIISEEKIEPNKLKLKLSWLIWHYDNNKLWFYFTERPYFYLKSKVKKTKYDCWFRVKGD